MTKNRIPRDIAFGLAGLLTLSLITATLVEKLYGSDTAFTAIYHSPWMIALWAVSAACSLFYLILRHRALSFPATGLHAALLLILAGAAVTYMWGEQGKLTLEKDAPAADSFILDEGGRAPLPFSISLDRAVIEYYPGTSTPMDYASLVYITPSCPVTGPEGPVLLRISMNKILDIDGYRFYQTSIGENSSTLSVSHDPWGIAITYGGYLLLLVSMVSFFFQRKSRFRALSRRAALPALLLILTNIPAMGQSPDNLPPTIPRALAARLGKVSLYWGDRVMPLQTMARDFCMKVHGSYSYRGLTAEQVVAGWLFYYDAWKHEPFIRVEGEEASRLLGLNGSRHASLKDFYSPLGYKLEHAVAGDLADRKLRDTDSRVALVTMVCTGSAFRVFPICPDGDTGAGIPVNTPVGWLSFADRPPVTASDEDYIFISTILDRISREIAGRQWKNAADEITRLREFQARTAPAGTRLNAELLYNRSGSPLIPGIAALIIGLAGFLPVRKHPRMYSAAALLLLLWVSGILGLRWYVGRHLPLSNGYETMLLMGWLSLAAALVFLSGHRNRIAGSAALTVAGLSLMVAMMGRAGATVSPLMPVLASPLLSIHVLLVMASYSLLAIIAILSAVTLCKHNPENTPRLCALLLYPAVFLLAAGIFVGAVWANQSWGRYWGWDPKETWALITLLVYALPLHSASFPLFRRQRPLAIYLLLAFLSVLMTYFGVNYFLTGLHSYA